MREYTTEELNKMSQPMLVNLVELHQNQLKTISAQLSYLTEQIALMNQRAFGRKIETSETLENQLTIFEVFNEPELLCDDSKEPEITEITVSTHTRKKNLNERTILRDYLQESLNISSKIVNLPNFSPMVIKNFRVKYTSVYLLFLKPLWSMNTMFISMLQRIMMEQSSKQTDQRMYSETVLLLLR